MGRRLDVTSKACFIETGGNDQATKSRQKATNLTAH
jgi:hypothetical protein